jgi:hypothetical protein
VITRVLLDLDAFYLEHRLCGDLDGDAKGERAWLACLACGARIERPVETSRRDAHQRRGTSVSLTPPSNSWRRSGVS